MGGGGGVWGGVDVPGWEVGVVVRPPTKEEGVTPETCLAMDLVRPVSTPGDRREGEEMGGVGVGVPGGGVATSPCRGRQV